MRKSGSLLIPLTLIGMYYAFWAVLVVILLRRYPALGEILPLGGVGELAASDPGTFEPVYTRAERTILAPTGPVRLLMSCVGAAILTVPVSWVYFM